ncbi:MAG: DNA-binding response regulator [Clostridiales bacterium GWB2_37_7]|nr:MAG: DNA-binding response regulator [Clostridiales bacterium GWB2_37_7]
MNGFKHVFVVDDEKSIRDLIKLYLEKENFRVTLFDSGKNVLEEFKNQKPDLLVLDIMIPETDGLELCREIRKTSEVPIVFVSARDEEFDRVLGLELGGDDYLSKPFSPRELMVRIRNIFKRLEQAVHSQEAFVKVRDITIFFERRCVEKQGVELKLTTKEYELFEFLIKNKGIPFNRDQLVEKIWGYDYIGESRIIDDLVKRIRKKLEDLESELEIKTVWGYGYKIDA